VVNAVLSYQCVIELDEARGAASRVSSCAPAEIAQLPREAVVFDTR